MRTKITFESINHGNYTIIPPALISESNARIRAEMKIYKRKILRNGIQGEK